MSPSGDGGYIMKEYTARELMEEIRHRAELCRQGWSARLSLVMLRSIILMHVIWKSKVMWRWMSLKSYAIPMRSCI